MQGLYLLPVTSPKNTTASLAAVANGTINNILATYPEMRAPLAVSLSYPGFYDWFNPANSPKYAGLELMAGSWLLDEKALTADPVALKAALKVFGGGVGTFSPLLMGGGKVNTAVPRGGSNSVHPAWRKTILHLSKGSPS